MRHFDRVRRGIAKGVEAAGAPRILSGLLASAILEVQATLETPASQLVLERNALLTTSPPQECQKVSAKAVLLDHSNLHAHTNLGASLQSTIK